MTRRRRRCLCPKAELFDYARRVFAAVDDAAEAVEDVRFRAPLKSRFMSGDSTYGDILLTCSATT